MVSPDSPERHANLGLVCAFTNRKEDAIREGRRAVELKPESKDAFDGAIMNCYLALISARVGEKELAFPLIERLLKTPGAVDRVDYSITVNDLRKRWERDSIRSDLRFDKLIASVAPNGYKMPAGMVYVRLVHLLDEQKRKKLMIIYGEDLAFAGLTPVELRKGGKEYNRWPAIEKGLVERAEKKIGLTAP